MRRLSLLLPLLAGCAVDSVGANGELGHLSFTLVSDWYLDSENLTEVDIVTGHAQHFLVDLTERGRRQADDNADHVRYHMEPDDGVEIDQGEVDDDAEHPDAPSFGVTVSEPGSYTLVAELEGELFDRIQLSFDQPSALELTLYTRGPWAEEFAAIEGEGPTQVLEGTQLAWLPIPLDADGERLVGDLAGTMSADPESAVVPAENVTHVNEEVVSHTAGVPSLYFIEPGDVTVTVTDQAGPGAGAHPFVVVTE